MGFHFYRFALTLSLTGLMVCLPLLALAKKSPLTGEYDLTTLPNWSALQTTTPVNAKLVSEYPDAQWWQQFGDAFLVQYQDAALKNNPSYLSTIARIEEARGIARQRLAEEFPLVTLDPNASRQRTPNLFRFSGTFAQFGRSISFYNFPVNVSYEADLFLRRRDRTRAAYQDLKSVQQEQRGAELTLVTDVASTYFNLLYADHLVRLQSEIVKLAQQAEAAQDAKFTAGLVAIGERNTTKEQAKQAMSRLHDFEKMQAVYRDQLAFLIGKPPERLPVLQRGTWYALHFPDKIETGVPSTLITRRPDILSAEHQLERARIETLVARKAFLPSFNLTAGLGLQAINFGNLFDFAARSMNLVGSVNQTIFAAGARAANLRTFKSRQEQALYTYYNTINNALREVEDVLASIQADEQSLTEVQSQANLVQKRSEAEMAKFNAGLVSRIQLAPVQAQAVTANQLLADRKLAALINRISLYKAIGGAL